MMTGNIYSGSILEEIEEKKNKKGEYVITSYSTTITGTIPEKGLGHTKEELPQNRFEH